MVKFSLITGGALVAAIVAVSAPEAAMAQGTTGPLTRVGTACPSGYSQGNTAQRSKPNPNMCYPDSSSSPAVYAKNGACAQGYRAEFGYCTSKADGAVYTPPTYGSITKANQMDRCPVGYWTDQNNIKSCVSPYQDKAPASRLKKGAACSADEVSEWGIYCTSRLHKLSRSEAENTAVADVNNLFVLSNGGTSPQGAEYKNTPGIVALFPASSRQEASSAGSASADASAATGGQCAASGSASGAVIGGAVAGDAGAVLGSMLGGLGKKKKKKEGC